MLGQTDYISNGSGTTSSTLDSPSDVLVDSTGQRLFVSDSGNNRVLVYNIATISNTSSTSGTSVSSIKEPLGLSIDTENDRLFLADKGNNRILIFDVFSVSSGESAIKELGQGSYFTKTANTNARGLSGARGVAIDRTNRRLFVADTANNRVLVHYTDDTTNGAQATKLLGQSSFTSATSGTTSATLSGPSDLFYDSDNDLLYVADAGNNRILVYDTSFITDGDAAIRVLGQANFTTGTSGSTSTTLNTPRGIYLDSSGDRLFVVDSGNNKVLVYDVAVITNGEAAVNVFGQSNFTGNTSGSTASTLDTPMGVAYDSVQDRLFVTDSDNNRVLIYDVASISDGEAATHVLGQADFTSNSSGTTAVTLNDPSGIAFDSSKSRLYVSDSGNNRVLIYEDVDAISNGSAALHVFGQASLTSGAAGLTASSLHNPMGLAFDSNAATLYVTDVTNNRTLIVEIEN